MHDLNGKNAFITGGANGIGLAMARAFLAEGMNVVIADVDAEALAIAQAELAGSSNARVLAVQLDVTNRQQFAEVADTVAETLGPVHVLCNNAGVYRGGTLDAVTYADWDWVMGVNVGGVVNGIQTMLPRMKAEGTGHIVNTASMAGVVPSPGLGVYNTSKFAVVGLSEALRLDLEPHGIGVSVLCPGMVRTRILESERTRPAQFDPDDTAAEQAAVAHSEIMHLAMGAGIEAQEVADLVVQGIRENQLYLFPHPELKASAGARTDALMSAFGDPDPERLAAQEAFMAALLETPQ